MRSWQLSLQGRGSSGRFVRIAALLIGAAAAEGCALTYTDGQGNRRAIGLLDISVRAPAASQTLAGDVVEVTSLGLSIGKTAQGGYLTAGFNRETTAALRDNALLLGNPITALSRNDEAARGGTK